MSVLEDVITNGNRAPLDHGLRAAGIGIEGGENEVTCADGFTVSVIAGDGTYCSPRPSSLNLPYVGEVGGDYMGPFHEVEVGFPSERPEPWAEWKEYAEDAGNPTKTVYGYVPVSMVRRLIESHSGEAS